MMLLTALKRFVLVLVAVAVSVAVSVSAKFVCVQKNAKNCQNCVRTPARSYMHGQLSCKDENFNDENFYVCFSLFFLFASRYFSFAHTVGRLTDQRHNI